MGFHFQGTPVHELRRTSYVLPRTSQFACRSAAEPLDLPARGSDLLEALSASQREQLDKFLDRLLMVNENMNLTAVRSKDDAYDRHVGDSLAVLPALDLALEQVPNCNVPPLVMDVGSGGGLPGLLLAIARPAWDLTLLDTLKKRIEFVDAAAAHVGVANARGLWARAEDAGKNSHGLRERERYDVVTARAVAEMRVLAELCLPMVRVGGFLVAYKGAEPENEVDAARNAIQLLGGTLLRIERVGSKGPDGDRTAVIIQKTSETPAKYPRRPGMPNKRPL
eukprot:CAMPEP_0114292696 /NCGR_PEP_ID=MMETSP0059-20121206/9203_1 /TAXON_ID=36894 /ORGANISM="Pyramimonas parkeae, Strain CCMP726" /LENGTH=279 /DNA_ID=CAMNT_0001414369 /DNA_START=89 /DNA_END=928 /DNA_ORIENTATION=+